MANRWRSFWNRVLRRQIPPVRTPPREPSQRPPSPVRQSLRSLDWDAEITDLFSRSTRGEAMDDDYAKSLFDEAYVRHGVSPERRAFARDTLSEYWEREYEVDFADAFDWGGWREWYSLAA